jgi:hypothetical protein
MEKEMITIAELKTKIEDCDKNKKGIGFYPDLTFVGHIGDKTHIGKVFLHIKNGKLGLCCAYVNCGSKKWGGRLPGVQNLTGKALITCQRCPHKGEMFDLDERNKEYLGIMPFIGKEI